MLRKVFRPNQRPQRRESMQMNLAEPAEAESELVTTDGLQSETYGHNEFTMHMTDQLIADR